MDEEPSHISQEKEPWWNNGDKVGGLFATITMLGLVILFFVIVIGLAVKLMF